MTATPHIGRSDRWFAPFGAADLDGDGLIKLVAYANHRIGERDNAGGIRSCNGRAEMIVAWADWLAMAAITFDGMGFAAKTISQETSLTACARAVTCKD